MTERTQNADFRIFADSPFLLEIPSFGGRRKPQIFAENRRFSQKTTGNRGLGSVILGPSPLARPYFQLLLEIQNLEAARFSQKTTGNHRLVRRLLRSVSFSAAPVCIPQAYPPWVWLILHVFTLFQKLRRLGAIGLGSSPPRTGFWDGSPRVPRECAPEL